MYSCTYWSQFDLCFFFDRVLQPQSCKKLTLPRARIEKAVAFGRLGMARPDLAEVLLNSNYRRFRHRRLSALEHACMSCELDEQYKRTCHQRGWIFFMWFEVT